MAALWLDSIGYLAAVLLPVMLGLIIVSPDLIPVLFGSRWEVSVGVVQILSVAVLIRGAPGVGLRLHGRGRQAGGDPLDPTRFPWPYARSAS